MGRRGWKHLSFLCVPLACLLLLLGACRGNNHGKPLGGIDEEMELFAKADTLSLHYAQHLRLVRHGDAFVEAILFNPWKMGQVLHRYLLVPKGKKGDETLVKLSRFRDLLGRGDVVRTPLASSVVFTAPHCWLMYELGCENAISGVCDADYINIKDIRQRLVKNILQGKDQVGKVVDCGSSMSPDLERISALHPEALFVSPFENNGGYGKLEKLKVSIIETADYMETSPLGRTEWMKFYGLLFGKKCEQRADSLFAAIEKEYLDLKEQAKVLPKGLSVLTERKTGSVWYVPGGQSTIGVLLKDANARYIFEDDTHSGSLAMSPEQILSKGKNIDIWAFKYFEPQPLSRTQLLLEYKGYEALQAFRTKNIYECSTSNQSYFELTSFHPEILLREFMILAHPHQFEGKLRFYKKMATL